MLPEHEKAIDVFAEAMVQNELDFWRKANPAKLESATPEMLTAFRGRMQRNAEKQLQNILDKRECYSLMNRGGFHPDNKQTRHMFETVTGITLPSTVGATRETVMSYIGPGIIGEIRQAEQDRREAAERDTQARIDRDTRENIERIANALTNDESIDGQDLVCIAEHLGIDIPLRTKGAILKRVTSVNSGGARIRATRGGKFSKFDSYWDIFKQVKTRVPDHMYATVGNCEGNR